jgi:signal transduction histidine kinase
MRYTLAQKKKLVVQPEIPPGTACHIVPVFLREGRCEAKKKPRGSADEAIRKKGGVGKLSKVGGKSTKPSKLTEEITSRQPSLPIYIAAHSQAEEALIKLGVLQNAIINSTHFSSIATDEKGVIQLYNVSAETMLGYMASDVINKFTPADLSDPLELIARAKALSLEMGTTISPGFEALVYKAARGIEDIYELTYLRKNGDRFPAVVSVTALRDPKDLIIGYLLIGTDNTERKKAEEKIKTMNDLARSNAELERFAHVASHDLQEPLRTVTSYLQLLEKHYKDKLDDNALEFIKYAVDGSNRMKTLINDLLAYSRVGTYSKEFALTDCEEVLARVLTSLQVSIEENKVKVTHDPLPKVMADDAQLESLFQNLIGNAIKFRGKKSPRIHVGVKKNEKDWIFSISDNGIGIDPQYFERIFIIFQRLHNREEYPGTGIGLAISKRIVERHGGSIWIESQPEKGSTFFFTLPK